MGPIRKKQTIVAPPPLIVLSAALLCLRPVSGELYSQGNNVCGKSCTEQYTQRIRTSGDCGLGGWSSCTVYRSQSFERTVTCYECCSGWSAAEDSGHCDIALCFGLAPKGTCRNGGTCTAPNNCRCPPGTQRPECKDIDECATDNGGCEEICENSIRSYRCNCRAGSGLVNEKECAPICFGQSPGKCRNGGTCVDIDKCDCPAGTSPPTCDDVNECSGDHGCSFECKNTLGSYSCVCAPGFGLLPDKRTCRPVCFGQEPGKCSLGNICEAPDQCNCEEGFKQPHCTDIDECVDPDLNRCFQVCVNTPGSFHCDCTAGYTFHLKQQSCVDLDECATSNAGCSDGCDNSEGSFTCTCPSGYEVGQDKKTCGDVDECAVNDGGCYLGCENADGSYRCECGHGYKWEADSKECKPVCFGGEAGVCQNGGTCSNPGVCSCLPGYQLPQCTDINECNLAGACPQVCENTVGSYTCSCHPGYELQEDRSCTDINECERGTAKCQSGCTNTDGSYSCECPALHGWHTDSLSCKPVCFGEVPGSCANEGECSSPGECVCRVGFEKPGCNDIDECAVDNGGCELMCINNIGSYECKCGSGYSWVPATQKCAPVCNLMDAGTCPNKGVCVETDVCQCALGYGGKLCSDVDECSEGVASCNYYMCHNTPGSYYCDCEEGFAWNKGKQSCLADCSFDEPGVCPNGGECSSPGQCTCPKGYQLPSCSDIDECAGDHGCSNGCVNSAGSYYCQSSTPGYGRLPGSEEDMAICLSLLPGECPNGGTCVKPDICNCPVGYSAPRCDPADACVENSDKCTGTDTCATAGGKFFCKTQEGYGRIPGEKMQKPVCFGMLPGQCPNGGECVNPDACRCADGFIPPRCEDKNECLTDNGGCEKACVNIKGSFYCSCWEGYGISANGDTCEAICFEADPGSCNGGGKCISPGNCSCADGYEGPECKDVNECLEGNGGCEGECHNAPGGYMCDCQSGFSWDQFRRLCRPVCNFGSPGVCPNDGVCSAPNVCECETGFESATCEDTDECTENDGGCSAGCLNLPGLFYCEGSTPGFGRLPGENVDKPVCQGGLPGTCPSGGTCTAPDVCACPTGYQEPGCKDVDECASGQAKCPGGCQNLEGSYYCEGQPGYGKAQGDTVYKPLCGKNFPGVCSNGGSCIGPGVCACGEGYLPPDCTEKKITCTTCDSPPCMNMVGPIGCRCTANFEQVTGGICSRRRPCACAIQSDCSPTSSCSCARGYEGDDCTDIDECLTNNGGCESGCVNLPGSFYCQAGRQGYGSLPGSNQSLPVCANAPLGACPNGGECIEPGVCKCPKGYQTPDCSDEDECASDSNTCQSGCENVIGSFRCDCPKDYVWDDVDQTCKASCFGQKPGTCANGGTCLRPWVCECKTGFALPDCSDIDECSFENGKCDQICRNTIGSYFCECPNHYGWNVASGTCKPICMDSPAGECPNGGECISPDSCTCPEGYRRPHCTDIDECANDATLCENECRNIKGSYYCTDGDGYGVVQGTGEKISLCYRLPPGVCPNDGTCIEPEKCDCPHGFMPPDCSDKNECIEDNGGCEETCYNTKGSYYCDCGRGYGWSAAEMACKPVCFGLPPGVCPNNGRCVDVGVCSCTPGFKPPDCSDIDECLTGDNVCGGAICRNNHGAYSCDCDEGYHWKLEKKQCLPICFGLVGVCLNHGTCIEPGVCECPKGFSLPRCTDIDECAKNNGGCKRACSNLPGSYQCSCKAGYQYHEKAKACQATCGSNPLGTCQNGGTCAAPEECHCLPGFDATNYCADIDECKTGAKCSSGSCVNTVGSYYCTCEQSGYGKGPSDTKCKPLCLSSSPGRCPNGGTCDSPGTCTCADGFEGPECSDHNECLSDNDCNGACLNQPGGYSCDCLFGHQWDSDDHACKPLCEGEHSCGNGGECVSPNTCSCRDGYLEGTCEDADECQSGVASCQGGCENIAGSYYCTGDKPGYGQGPGDKYMKPLCNGLKPGTCSHGGICFSPGTCSCPPGFHSIDSDCQDMDECAKANGGCGRRCENLLGSFRCSCEHGYGWDEQLKKCAPICDGLAPGQCPDGGVCVSPGVCECKDGFKQPDCSDVDECQTGEGDVCTSGCVNRHGFFFCQGSTPGYGRKPGESEDKPICHDSEYPGSCPNGGKCTAPRTCECQKGFELPFCADINECETKTLAADCLKCINSEGSYQCDCEAGYSWSSQQEKCAAVCYDNPAGECPHGGRCVEPYVCACLEGFTEPNCDDIDECAEKNGGCSQMCDNRPGSFSCRCNNGYTLMEDLTTCSDTDECEVNNGDCPQKCVNMEGAYRCTCGEGYELSKTGVGCDDVDECLTVNGGCAEVCVNTIGSFNCQCGGNRGVGPDGKSCADICYHYDPGTCGSGGVCLKTDQCLCYKGYNLPYCTDIDECADMDVGCSDKCKNTDGSFVCTCANGYYLTDDQKTCADVDECSEEAGPCSHDCVNTESSFLCVCPRGYFLDTDRRTCLGEDACDTDNGGCSFRCENTQSGPQCVCYEGYRLAGHDNCIDVDECTSNNGGCSSRCRNTQGSRRCECEPGFRLTADGKTCERCSGDSELDCLPLCVKSDSGCLCPDGYYPHQDGTHCSGGCPCQNGGYCVTELPLYECDCSGTGFIGRLCTVPTVDIPSTISVRYPGGNVMLPVTVRPKIAIIIKAHVGNNIGISTNPIAIKTPATRSYFNVSTNASGIFRIEYGLAGVDENRFDKPAGTDVISGDVFQRHQLFHKVLPVGCFKLAFDHTVTKTADGKPLLYNIQFLSTSPWYKLHDRTDVFFTFGIVHSTGHGKMELPLCDEGIELTARPDMLHFGPISPYRKQQDGVKVGEVTRPTCKEIELWPEDTQAFRNAKSLFQSLFRSIKPLLPAAFSLENNHRKLDSRNSLHVQVLTGFQLKTVGSCKTARVVDEALYYVFRFSDGLKLKALGQTIELEETQGSSQFCLIVSSPTDVREAVHLVFPDTAAQRIEKIVQIKSIQDMSGSRVSVRGLSVSPYGHIEIDDHRKPRWNGYRNVVQDFPRKSSLCLHLDIEKKTALSNAWVDVKTSVDVLFANSYFSQTLIPLFIQEDKMVLGFGEDFEMKLSARLWSNDYPIKLHRQHVYDDGFATVGVEHTVRSRGVGSNPVGAFFRVKPSGHLLPGQPLFGDIDIQPYLSDFYLTFDRMNTFQAMGNYAFGDSLVEIKNLTNELSAYIKSAVSNPELKTLPELELIKTKIADIAVAITKRQNLNVSSLILDSQLAASVVVYISDVRDKLQSLDQKLNLRFRSFFNDRLTDINARLDMLSGFVMQLTETISMAITQYLQGPNSWGLNTTMSLHLAGKILNVTGAFHYTGSELGSHCPANNKLFGQTDQVSACMSAKVVGSRTRDETRQHYRRIWEFIQLEVGSSLTAIINKGANHFSVEAEVTFLALGIHPSSRLRVYNSTISVEAEGKLWGVFPARMSASFPALSREPDETWSLLVKGEFSQSGEGSFPDKLSEALQTYAGKQAASANSRIEGMFAEIKIAKQSLLDSKDDLEKLESKITGLRDEYQQMVKALDSSKQDVLTATDNLGEELQQLNAICMNAVCKSACVEGYVVGLCEADGDGPEMPCVKMSSCAVKVPDFNCLRGAVGCHEVRLLAYNRSANAITRGRVEAYEKAHWQSIQLTDRKELLQQDLDQSVEMQTVTALVVGSLEEKLKKLETDLALLRTKLHPDLYLQKFSLTHGQSAMFNVTKCTFHVNVVSRSSKDLNVACVVDVLLTGQRTVTVRVDFDNVTPNIWKISKEFISKLSKIIKSLDTEIDDPDASMKIGGKLDASQMSISADVMSWFGECQEAETALTFVTENNWNLLNTTNKAMTNINGFENFRQTFFISRPISKQESGINDAVLEQKYGIRLPELTVFLSTTDPLLHPEFFTIYDTVRNMLEVKADNVYYVLNNTLTEQAKTDLQVKIQDDIMFKDCVSMADCGASLFMRVNQSLDAVSQIPVKQTRKSLQKMADMFSTIFQTTLELRTLGQTLADIKDKLHELPLQQIFCQSFEPSFTSGSELSVPLGEPAGLSCVTNVESEDKISWWKRGSSSPVLAASNDLDIPQAWYQDEGTYECTVTSKMTIKTGPPHTITLTSPPKISSAVSTRTVCIAGDDAELVCQASALPGPKYGWTTNAVSHPELNNQALRLTSAKTDSAGLYICKATNPYSSALSKEIFLDVQVGRPSCPHLTLWTGFISRRETAEIAGSAIQDHADFRRTLLSVLTAEVEKQTSNLTKIEGFVAENAEIELLLRPYSCDSSPAGSSSECLAWYRKHLAILEQNADKMRTVIRESTAPLTSDYYFNSAYVALKDPMSLCPHGYRKHTAFVCVEDKKTLAIGPPRKLESSVINEKAALDWLPPEGVDGFIKGYNVTITLQPSGALYTTLSTTTPYHYFKVAFPRGTLQIQVRAYTKDHKGEWAYLAVSKPVFDAQVDQVAPVVGAVVGSVLGVVVAGAVGYLLVRNWQDSSRLRRARRVSPSPLGSSVDLISRYSIENVSQADLNMSLNIPDCQEGMADIGKPEGMSNRAYQKHLSARKIYMAS